MFSCMVLFSVVKVMFSCMVLFSSAIVFSSNGSYPDESVKNGFDWEFDNSNLTDASCLEWEFVRIDNGYMLNCYPESIIHASPLLLLSIKELDDPYWAKPLQDQSFEVMDSNQLKLTLLNNEFLKLITPQENITLALT